MKKRVTTELPSLLFWGLSGDSDDLFMRSMCKTYAMPSRAKTRMDHQTERKLHDGQGHHTTRAAASEVKSSRPIRDSRVTIRKSTLTPTSQSQEPLLISISPDASRCDQGLKG